MTKPWPKDERMAAERDQGISPKRFPLKRYKVVRIYYAWTRTKGEALRYAVEGAIEPEAKIAIAEEPKEWKGNLLKQLFG
jgi:hypothetical protein